MANGTLVEAKSSDAAKKARGRSGNAVAEVTSESRDGGRWRNDHCWAIAHGYLILVS